MIVDSLINFFQFLAVAGIVFVINTVFCILEFTGRIKKGIAVTVVLILVIGLLIFGVAGTARADEIYSYTGPAPADLSGSFTTPTQLVSDGSSNLINAIFSSALSWNFTDGQDVWTPANSTFSGGAFVNPDGTFMIWAFNLLSTDGSGLRAFSYTTTGATYYQDQTPIGDSWVANQNLWEKPKGSWTMVDPPSSVPEPGTFALVLVTTLSCIVVLIGRMVNDVRQRVARIETKIGEPLA